MKKAESRFVVETESAAGYIPHARVASVITLAVLAAHARS